MEIDRKRQITIIVPCSTSNIGPGFDVLGIALSKYLELVATIPGAVEGNDDAPAGITITYEGDSPATVPLNPAENLITRIALQVARAHGARMPPSLAVHIINPIPLGRGLGSSGSAVVAGVALANECCRLGLSTQRILDLCLTIEGHPDNISASIIGGFVASYCRAAPDDVPEVSNASSCGVVPSVTHDMVDPHPEVEPFMLPKYNLARHCPLRFSSKVKAVVIIPKFELSTKLARSVLPPSYSRSDVVFNLQRIAVLCTELSKEEPDAAVVGEAMQDRIHQMYRQHLVPGLPQILQLSHKTCPGLLGICVSGAGPTVLALATGNFDAIGEAVVKIFATNVGADGLRIEATHEVLDVVNKGLSVSVVKK